MINPSVNQSSAADVGCRRATLVANVKALVISILLLAFLALLVSFSPSANAGAKDDGQADMKAQRWVAAESKLTLALVSLD